MALPPVPKNFVFSAFSITERTSFTPELIALSLKNGVFKVFDITSAKVVLPTPGGPQKMHE